MIGPAAESEPMIGHVIAERYRIERLLGKGGMGAVYQAIHLVTHRRVALKMVISREYAQNAEMVGRFQREARAAGAIDTQHIVQVLDSGVDPMTGLPFLVMELLNGEDLQGLVQRVGPLPPELALRIAAQACVGLDKAHQAGVVHRDIKPANLYLARRDAGEIVIKLLDFGIAKVVDHLGASENKGLTRTGSMLGSPLYMSPEQAMGLKTIDHRTDIWSLGAVLYEALVGRTPHHHIDTLGQLIVAIVSQPPPPVQGFAPWVAPEVAAIVHGALSMKPESRFQSAAQMLDAIRALLPSGMNVYEAQLCPLSPQQRAYVAPVLALSSAGTLVSGPVASGAVGASTAPGVPPTTTSGLANTGSTPARSSKVALIVGSVLVVGAIGGAAFAVTNRHAKPDVAPAAEPAPASVAPMTSQAPEISVAPAASAQRVRVQIAPPIASVEIDGRPVSVSDGSVEFAGTLGSVHPIRVYSGNQETRGEIVVTEDGAIPKQVTLGVAIQKRPAATNATPIAASAAPAASAPVTKRASTSAGPAPKPTATGATIDKTFE